MHNQIISFKLKNKNIFKPYVNFCINRTISFVYSYHSDIWFDDVINDSILIILMHYKMVDHINECCCTGSNNIYLVNMKYIVLSFDDGFYDFYDNVVPVLNKYNVKSTISVVTGYAELKCNVAYKTLTVDNLIELHRSGFELSNHSNMHLKNETIDDFEISRKKILKWTNQKDIGLVMPYNKEPSEELKCYFENHYSYVSFDHAADNKSDVRLLFLRILNKLFKGKNEHINLLLCYYRRLNDINNVKKPVYVNRIGIYNDVKPSSIIRIIRYMSKKKYLTLMFHSIIRNKESCYYPDGAWNIDAFESLIRYICSRKKKYKIITQLELVELMNKRRPI